MDVLFVGGSGNISLEASREAVARGLRLTLLNRGTRGIPVPGSTDPIVADITDEATTAARLEGRSFDAVVDFIVYRPEEAERAIRLFEGRTGQYVYISSASVYRKPPSSHVITEATPLGNPFWPYAADKLACERVFERAYRERGFPATIVRPSHTYGNGWVPLPFGSSDFTVPFRMLEGKEIAVPGDGQALWTLTHARDFAAGILGLLGKREAIGEAFQITGDEALTWDEIHRTIAGALGVEAKLVHVPVDFIEKMEPELAGRLRGDKVWTSLFDCSKLKRLVPEFRATVPFAEGIRESLAWLDARPDRKIRKPELDATMDRLVAAWRRVLAG